MKHVVLTAVFCLGSLFTMAQNAILGTWWNEEKTSKIEVYKEGSKYFGKVIYLKNNTNPDGSSPRTDYNNPDKKLQKRPVVGVIILKNLVWDADDKEWTDGEIYDPKSGNTYSLFARMEKDGSLYMKGYIGISLIGRATKWTRAN